MRKLGFGILSTDGTGEFLKLHGIENTQVKKLHEGRPNIADSIKNEEINLIINTPIGKASMYDDSYIRRMAIQHKLPYITSMAAAEASVEGIESVTKKGFSPKCLQDYYKELPAF